MVFKKMALIALAIALVVPSVSRAANLVSNGDFENLTGSSLKLTAGTSTPVTGWTVADGGTTVNPIFGYVFNPSYVDTTGITQAQGAAVQDANLQLWGPGNTSGTGGNSANGLNASPTGGNYVAIDTDTQHNGSISQTIATVVGQTYSVSFQYAEAKFRNGAGTNWNGATTGQWQVGFGSQTQTTDLLTIASHGFSGWQDGNFTFTATDTSTVLSFLATGGGTAGLPPVALLDGVSVTTSAVPEPGTLSLAGVGLAGLALAVARRRAKSAV